MRCKKVWRIDLVTESKISLNHIRENLHYDGDPMILSIKPKFSRQIFRGEKTVELRKVFPPDYSGFAVVYESSPQKRIRGLIEIDRVRSMGVEELAGLTEKTKVTKSFVVDYFGDRETGYAVGIGEVLELGEKPSLKELREKLDFTPPQNYKYLRDETLLLEIEERNRYRSSSGGSPFSGEIFDFLEPYMSDMREKVRRTTDIFKATLQD